MIANQDWGQKQPQREDFEVILTFVSGGAFRAWLIIP
jgi:hypothetical protein